MYNILTCSGFEKVSGWVASTGCLKARFAAISLFFILAIIRRWGAEEWGIDFSFLISSISGIFTYIILISFTGNVGWSLIIGIAIGVVGGYVGGMFLGSEGGDY